jgi:cardiolipin synthase (CMP-forming)
MDNYSLFSYFSLFCKSINLPILLTLFRFLLIPFICIAIVTYSWDQALLLFLVAAITDVLDGALARLINSETALGAYLDPLADKCLVLFSFWSISITHFADFTIPYWFNISLFIKELVLIFAAAYFSMLKNNIKIKPSAFGKAANFIQSLCIIMIFFAGLYRIKINQFLNPILFFIMIMSFVALLHYFWVGYKELNYEQ